MNVDDVGDDCVSESLPEEVSSPRKKLRADKATRKSWSMMDRRPDQEVLQEMGLSLLEQDEAESFCEISPSTSHKPNLKRKHDDIENVNPNVNSSITSPTKYSPKSTKMKMYSPSPGPSKGKSPESEEKSKSLYPTDTLESTLLLDYLIEEEETPSGQVCTQYLHGSGIKSGSTTSSGVGKKYPLLALGQEEEMIISRRSKLEPVGIDTFSVLSDEMILSVFRWLPKRTLANCMLVCKRWYQVACDESLWQRLDLGNKVLAKNALGRILARKPVIVRLASTEIAEWQPTTPATPSRIQYLDLSMSSVKQETLDCLLERCPNLKKLSMENLDITDTTCSLIGRCKNLETLNLAMCRGITAEGLAEILKGCGGLQSLNISWCDLCEEALTQLVKRLPQKLQRLNISGAKVLTDEMVRKLVARCPRLLELDVSDCSLLGAAAVLSILKLSRLDHLALSRCYMLPPHVLTKLSSMPSLQYLDVRGMLHSGSLKALGAALPAIQINNFMFSAVARPTVGTKRTSIWGLRTRDC